ncbi:MAG: quinone-dependent dihydroorotate dehydrogenase [Actinomycetales bacterium]
MTYERLVRPTLFRLDPERAHDLALGGLAAASALAGPIQRRRARVAETGAGTTVFGLDFPSRVGVAAGLDKDGRALRAWPLLGFGFIEVGTVTAQPQPGNPAPRLFRLPADRAIVNRMGFNNAGAAALAVRLHRLGPLPVPLGISLGKSRATPVEDAVDDYLSSLRLLHAFADYVVVNVSSPNTPGLRSLQDRDALATLVDRLVAESRVLAGDAHPAPLLVKVAPDLGDQALEEVVDVCLGHEVSGLVATNTTLERCGLRHPHPAADETGGLSGPPLAARALDVVRRIRGQAGDRLPVIGVGGISGPDDALRMVDAGASLVQLYTGLIYQGPRLVRRVARALQTVAADAPSSSQTSGTT